MKTTQTSPWLKLGAYSAVSFFLALYACKDNTIDFTANDSQNVENEATTDAYFQDADDMSGVAVSAADETKNGKLGDESGRTLVFPNSIDIRFACATVTIEKGANNTADIPRGTITINFGTGCTDSKGNVRKGKIIIAYNGKRFLSGSTVTTTLENYFINGVKIEGTRVLTNVSGSAETAPKFNIVTTGGKATWPDATFATREAQRTVEWTRATSPVSDQLSITGSASGSNRNGRTYVMNITSPLIFKRECALSDKIYIAVQGTKELTVDGKKITIDYGAGDCDRKVKITINGKSTEVTVRGDD